MINKGTDTLLVGFTKSDNGAVLVVGRKKKGQAVEVINAFEGEAAIDIYNMLTTKVAQVKEDTINETEEL
jgi:hypothetical protein